jgi:uncharacterized repeat protein (TIGR01451 family)
MLRQGICSKFNFRLFPGLLLCMGMCLSLSAFAGPSDRAELELRKSSAPLAPVAGETFRWIYEIENFGPNDAISVEFTDTLPDGFQYVDDEANGFCTLISEAPDMIRCRPAGSPFTAPAYVLPVGETVHFEILVAIDPDVIGRYTNTADISIGNSNFSITSFVDDVEVVGVADLRIWASVLPENQVVGEQMKYFIVVDNLGPSTARDVWIHDTLTTSDPELFGLNGCSLSVATDGGAITHFNCNFGLSTGIFDLALMGVHFLHPRGAPSTQEDTNLLDFTDPGRVIITVEGTAAEGMDLFNLVDTGSTTFDPDYSNNVTSAGSSFTSVADLSITKTAEGEVLADGDFEPLDLFAPGTFPDSPTFETAPDRVSAGRRIRYSLLVHNDGPSNAVNVTVTDKLPAGVVPVPGSLSIDQGSCNFGTPGNPDDPMICSIGTLYEPGHDDADDVTIIFDVMVDLDTARGTVISNGVEAWSDTMDLDNSENVDGLLTLVTVEAPDPLTEVFDQGAIDLDGARIELQPWPVDARYDVCIRDKWSERSIHSIPQVLALGDDDSAEVILADGKKVLLYGQKYDRVHVGSNGYLTFGGADSEYFVDLENHFSLPRVSAIFADLDPNVDGSIWWAQETDRLVVVWDEIWSYDLLANVRVIAELYFNGNIFLSYPSIDSPHSIVGLSDGQGIPDPFYESNFVGGPYPVCLLIDGFE